MFSFLFSFSYIKDEKERIVIDQKIKNGKKSKKGLAVMGSVVSGRSKSVRYSDFERPNCDPLS